MRKIALAAIILVALLGATPVAAGYWSGTGQYVSWEEFPGVFVYPWYQWNGSLIDGTFQGNWAPNLPKWEGGGPLYRTFYGSIISYSTPDDGGPTIAYCEGDWSDSHDNWSRICGWFTMEFNLTDGTCEGTWGFNGDKIHYWLMWGTGY
jgi:hypothetical protein